MWHWTGCAHAYPSHCICEASELAGSDDANADNHLGRAVGAELDLSALSWQSVTRNLRAACPKGDPGDGLGHHTVRAIWAFLRCPSNGKASWKRNWIFRTLPANYFSHRVYLMNYARTDPRRRGLHQESSPLNLAYDWSTPNSVKAKSIRSIALSGLQDLILYDLVITKPVGVVELTGSRAGTVNTVFLAVFSHDIRSNAASFRLDSDYAMGTLGFPASMFAAVLQMVSLNNVYFRICSDAERNAVSTEASFAMSC